MPRLLVLVLLLALTLGTAAAQEAPPLAQTERLGGGTVGGGGTGGGSGGGTGSKPALALFGLPVVGDPGPGLALDGGLPGALATLIVGLGVDGSTHAPSGATLWPAPPLLQQVVRLDAQGDSPVWSAGPAPLPAALMGVDVWAQGMVQDPLAHGGLAFTDGLRLRAGAGRAAAPLYRERYVQLSPKPGLVSPVLATADLDGNRRPDVLVAQGTGTLLQVQVHRQLTGGTLAPPLVALLGLGGGPVIELSTGDVDGDGVLDVVALLDSTFAPPARVVLLRGRGDGGLHDAQSLSLPPGALPRALCLADLDGDGRAEVVLAGWTATQLAVLSGTAAGLDPTPLSLLDLPDEPALRSMALADRDGDGRPDLAIACVGPAPRLVLSTGQGDGSFASPPLDVPAGVDSPACLLVADLDGDHLPDVLVGDGTQLAVDKLALHRGDGAGGVSVAEPRQPDFPPDAMVAVGFVELATGDVDSDGNPDVFALSQASPGSGPGGEVWTLRAVGRDPTPRALNTGAYLTRLRIADMDVDGRLDLLGMSILNSFLASWFGWFDLAADGTVVRRVIPDFWVRHTRAGDLDGDGWLDLVGIPWVGSARVSVARGGAPRLFHEPVHWTAPGSLRDLTLADVDLDGDLDVVASVGPAGGGVLVFAGGGDGSLGTPTALVPGRNGWGVQVGDVDLDGWPDIAAVMSGLPGGGLPTDDVVVMLGQGGGAFAPPVSSDIERFAQNVQLADLEGDGLLDAVINTSDGLRVLPGLGGAAFGPVILYPDPNTGYTQAPFIVADLDGDGDPDAVRQTFSALLQVWLNDGLGGLSVAQQEFADALSDLAVADVNGDGAVDVLCNGVMLGFGDGSFAPRQAGGPAGAVGDWDHDGDLDASDGGFLYLNQAR